MMMLRRIRAWSRERLAERVSAASYGTVLILVALTLVDSDDVAEGFGWELVTGVGVATWVAHLYAEILGGRLRNAQAHQAHEIRRAMADGLPILLATVPPAVALFLGRIEVLTPRAAFWTAVILALLQLVGLGAVVGLLVSDQKSYTWRYAAGAAMFGIPVVVLMLALGH
ncbi:MAG TPA: hypothetical protein VFL72_03530 [Acidimicrobiia bacterium]|nr:hypothetical protein [Acidimicrobiia bacterium]